MSRAQSEDWYWSDPSYQLLAIIAESTYNRNVMAGTMNPKAKRDDLLRIPRPWDHEKTEKKIGAGALPITELDEWLSARERKVS